MHDAKTILLSIAEATYSTLNSLNTTKSLGIEPNITIFKDIVDIVDEFDKRQKILSTLYKIISLLL